MSAARPRPPAPPPRRSPGGKRFLPRESPSPGSLSHRVRHSSPHPHTWIRLQNCPPGGSCTPGSFSAVSIQVWGPPAPFGFLFCLAPPSAPGIPPSLTLIPAASVPNYFSLSRELFAHRDTSRNVPSWLSFLVVCTPAPDLSHDLRLCRFSYFAPSSQCLCSLRAEFPFPRAEDCGPRSSSASSDSITSPPPTELLTSKNCLFPSP